MPDIHRLDGGSAPVNLGGGYTLRAPGLKGSARVLGTRAPGSRGPEQATEDFDRAFADAGIEEVTAIELAVSSSPFPRAAAPLRGPDGADRHRADVTDAAAIATAIGDAPLVVMASHAPYRTAIWRELLPRMERPVLDHVARTGATLVLPESLYAFDPDTGPITARTALRPRSGKGEVRRALLEARTASGARVRSVVAGDFVGPMVRSSYWADQQAHGAGVV